MRTVRRSLLGAGTVTVLLAAGTWALHGQPRPCPAADDTSAPGGVMTPYRARLDPASYIQGATLDVADAGRSDPSAVLRRMRDEYRINTINVYGLERWSGPRLDLLFDVLRTLDMRIALRVEWYDQRTFAFRPQDATRVLAGHRTLLTSAARAEHRDRVAYVMLNMPVDDPLVQQRVGGVNSATSRARQVAYATKLVAGVRSTVGATRIFLGLFYGWDGSYEVPSYAPSRPDGYVLTNYSYPDTPVAAAGSPVSQIIGEPRLRITADRATRAAGKAPIVVEYGFHTLTYQNGSRPDQVAGLVVDPTAKNKALIGTTRFYCERYPNVIGTMYFGYNTYKAEGSPPRRLDFGLAPQ